MKPVRTDHDHEDYFTAKFRCANCNAVLGSYDYGRAWCDGSESMKRPVECPSCGAKVDWGTEEQYEND